MVFFSINLMNGKIRQMMMAVIIAFVGPNPSNERCYVLYGVNSVTKQFFWTEKIKIKLFFDLSDVHYRPLSHSIFDSYFSMLAFEYTK
ncbi:hypothetical protein GA069_23295 [Vibrio parahaemolyticus]|nr:hypothetical protein [Vibrio parahaemolyticus]EGQ8199573.1 hypothetical protein [Vibrio parahaemolyticus]EGQ9075056.1 hypothetical protein [Vibrio parahaemolyticus]EGQ9132748.1 hypothetical protein [Vibrio parahaemolyticus]